ncbi:MAG: hypothetical protein A3F46_00855 [Legionellales bacterium RIFCSPHIGHO2_12_FULL_42_9]|nr:MAG: hypothetical protein A3F46_00855 [Legionellales bacterium RIFCSPHIGHO2_12_FULL_42_9]
MSYHVVGDTNRGSSTQVYFDCNATTPVLPGAIKAATHAMTALYGNPSSSHSSGLQARSLLESTREIAAQLVGANPEQIIFTSGATEAIQLAIFSVLKACKNKPDNRATKLLYGATEHKVVPEALRHWTKILNLPYEVVELPVDHKGQISIETLQEELPQAVLLCTMAVNNETGVIQNLAAIENVLLSIASSAFWLVDSVQALGKISLNLNSSRIDYATFSGHKLYAPKGIGFLYNKKNAPVIPLIVGGGQEKNFRSGTENLPGIAALGFVLKQLVMPNSEVTFQSNEQLVFFRGKLLSELKAIFPNIIFNTPFDTSVPTTINFSVPGLSGGELLDLFDTAGLRVSGGSACNSSKTLSSHVLLAMGKKTSVSASSIRLSFGPCTTLDEIERGCDILRECATALNKTYLLNNEGTIENAELEEGILQFRSGATNSWIMTSQLTRSCIIIDPCIEVVERIEHYVKNQNLRILAILDTHGHADHDSIRPLLHKNLDSYFNEDGHNQCSSLGWPTNMKNAYRVTLENQESVPAIPIHSTVHGELVLLQLQTPGHTDDSQTFLLGVQKSGRLHKEDIHFAFSGDMILSGGLGRTNFVTSNSAELYHSLRKLQSVIGPNTLLCPSHDYDNSFCTNYSTEIKLNPLMRLALNAETVDNKNDFITKKAEIDATLAELEKNFQGIVCGVTKSIKTREDLALMINPTQINQYLYNKKMRPLVIDVSERQEALVSKNWNSIGLRQPPLNVPLSNLINFIQKLFVSNKSNPEILFICRSGERSLQAVKSLRRLGFANVWNLSGGIALASCDYLLNIA